MMARIRYFVLFAGMAWLCVFRPSEGDDMVACALEGKAARRRAARDPLEVDE